MNKGNDRLRRTANCSTAMLCLGLLATPAIAATDVEPGTTPKSLSASARDRVARMDMSQAAEEAPAGQTAAGTGTTASTGDKTFFKSGKGVLAVVLLATAVGYTVYSAHHNRVQSPNR